MLKLLRLIILPLLIASGGYLLWAGYQEVRGRTLDEFNSHQLSLARQTAKGLKSFINNYQMLTSHLAANPAMINFGPEGEELMKSFYSSHHGVLSALTRLDAHGRIVFTVPANPKVIGVDVSGQEHNAKILREHRPVVSDVFRAVQGYDTVAVSVPIFDDQRFAGVLGSLVPFKMLASDYLDDVGLSRSDQVLLISKKGVILYASQGREAGRDARRWAAGCPSLEAMLRAMLVGGQGTAAFNCAGGEGGTGPGRDYLAVYLPIEMGVTRWSLALATPEREVLSAMAGFRDRWLLAAGLLLLGALAYGLMEFRRWAAAREGERRRRAESALVESEQRYRNLVEFSPVPILVQQEGVFVYANPATLRLHGARRPEDLLGRTLSSFVDPSHWERVDQAVRSPRQPGELLQYEVSIVTLDHLSKDLEVTAMPVGFEGRRATLMICRDVTEKRRAEAALRQAEEKYRGIFENAMEGIYQSTLEGRYISANPALARIYGYGSPQELIEDISDIGSQIFAEPERRRELLDRLASKGEAADFHARIRKKDGSTALVSINARAVRGADGRLLFLEGTVEDITDRQRAAEALRLSEEKFAKAFRHSPVWVLLSTLAEGRFLEVNDTFLAALGFRRDEVIGHTSAELGIWENWAQRQMMRQRLEQLGRVRDWQVRFRTKDGRVLTVMIYSELIEVDGERALVSVVLDISERVAAEAEKKMLEAQLVQARKMEAVGTLAGGIAHDFNNILQAISGYVQLMLRKSGENTGLGAELTEVDRMVARATELVRGLLTFSRKVEPVFKPVDLNERVREAVRLLERTIPKMISIHTRLDGNLWTVRGDPTQLDQVLMNLGANARDAMPDGGELWLETVNLDLGRDDAARQAGLEPGPYALLVVRDTGVGIDRHTLASIFDPFFTTKGVGKGTGLGLSTVYGVVKAHGGHVACDSEPGLGTVFRVYLPVLEGHQAAEMEAEVAPAGLVGGSEALLLVDDETAILGANRELLEELGYRVLTASTGEEALDIYEKSSGEIKLVLLDLGMPGMGGQATLERLLAGDPGAKVLIASGYADDGQVRQCLRAGAAGFMSKPYQIVDLARRVRQVLDGGTPENGPGTRRER